MDININDLPIIDKIEGVKLAGGRKDLANEILEMLVNRLKKDYSLIEQLNMESNYSALKDEVHRLHGAVCYCGTPRLKTVLFRLETDLKNNIMRSRSGLLRNT